MKFFNPDVRDLLVRGNLRDHKENNKNNISVVIVNIQAAVSPDFHRFYKRTMKIKKYTFSASN